MLAHLSDAEREIIRRGAEPIHWQRRAAFVAAITSELRTDAHNPATLTRIVASVQQRFLRQAVGADRKSGLVRTNKLTSSTPD
jgi:hypothetical protein